MAGRLSWSDAEHLLPGERFVREARAELYVDIVPYRWAGTLLLTSDRLFFIPYITNPLIENAACWLDEIIAVRAVARHGLSVATRDRATTFELTGGPFALRGRGRSWLRTIEAMKPGARHRGEFGLSRRRAG